MVSLPVFIVDHVSMISNLISLRSSIATPPNCLLGLSLHVMVYFRISRLELLLNQVSVRVKYHCHSLSERESISLFSSIPYFFLQELKEELIEAII